MLLTKNQIIKKLEENKNKIKSFGVKKLWLFGSYARGEQDENSDIDFLVEFENKKDTLISLKLGVFLEDIFDKEVDLGEKEYIKKDYRDFILKECIEGIKI